MQLERVGPYRIERLLGSGGMGTVYEAWDERLQRSVAIKCIHVAKELSPDRRERLLREARSAAALTHRRIAQVYDVVEHEGRDYIVMELVQGTSLATRIATGQLPVADALDIGRQIAEGLEAAHERGIVHRDLKADNVLIDGRGQVKILDFGLAKSTDPERREESLTEEGVVMGTSRAMSPEQASGRPVDTRSDLFSLGSLLYEMLTGTHPFQGSSPLETMHRVVRHHPAPVRKLRPEIPVEVELLVESLLEKDPRRRPESTRDIARALAGLASAHGTMTLDAASVSRVTSRARRLRLLRRSKWAAVAAVVLALATSAGAWWWLQRPRPPLVVAVPKVEILADSPSEDVQLLADAVRIALLNGVAVTEGLLAVDPSTVDGIQGPPAAIAKAVAAQEVLVGTLTPHDLTSSLELRRVHGANGALVRTMSLNVPTESLELATDGATAALSSLYPGRRPETGAVLSHADRPQDLRRFLEIQRTLDELPPGTDRAALLDELDAIRISSPHLLDVYVEEVSLARYLFRTRRDERFLDRARLAVDAGRRIAPRDLRILEASFQLASATYDLAGESEAIEALKRLAPADPTVLEIEARLAKSENRTEDARNLYQAEIRLRPSWQAHVSFGQFELGQGNMKAGVDLLKRALELAPDNQMALGVLGEALAVENPEQAVPLLKRVAELTGRSRYFTNLGLAYMLLGRNDEAAAVLETALEKNPKSTGTMMNLADAYQLLGRHDDARGLYQQILEEVGSDAHAGQAQLLDAAYCQAQLGDSRQAVATLDRALAAPAETRALAELHYQASLVLCLAGELNSSLLHAQKAVSAGLNPIWFRFAWFDPLRKEPTFQELLSSRQPAI